MATIGEDMVEITHQHKKESSEDKAFRLAWENTKEKRDHLIKEITNQPTFQKELKEQKKKCHSCPKNNGKELYAYMDKVEKDARTNGQEEWVYFKECRDWCDKWKINFIAFCMRGRIRPKMPVHVVTTYKNKVVDKIGLITDSPDSEEKDFLALAPLVAYAKNYHFGKAPERRGSPSDPKQPQREDDFIRDYKLFKKRGDKHALRWAAERSGFSPRRGRQILKKHGIK